MVYRLAKRGDLRIHVEAAVFSARELDEQTACFAVFLDGVFHQARAVLDRGTEHRVELALFRIHVRGEIRGDLANDVGLLAIGRAIALEQPFDLAMIVLEKLESIHHRPSTYDK